MKKILCLIFFCLFLQSCTVDNWIINKAEEKCTENNAIDYLQVNNLFGVYAVMCNNGKDFAIKRGE